MCEENQEKSRDIVNNYLHSFIINNICQTISINKFSKSFLTFNSRIALLQYLTFRCILYFYRNSISISFNFADNILSKLQRKRKPFSKQE